MPTEHYDALRHFADSWGLLYMLGTFIVVAGMLILPGASKRARTAAQIPLHDDPDRGDRRSGT